MPQTMPSGQSRRRFQVGSGLYTTGDAQRGTTPTPSQARRGLTPDDPDRRWFALDQATKQAWQSVAQLGQSGRSLFNTVNRIRPSIPTSTTDTPPPGPYAPTLYPASNLTVYAGDPTGDDAVWTLDVAIPDNDQFLHEGFELAYYIAREPATGPVIRGAQWYASYVGFAYYGPYPNLEALWNLRLRGSDQSTEDRRTLPAGAALRARLTPCTDEGYPGPPIYLQTIVLPYRS